MYLILFILKQLGLFKGFNWSTKRSWVIHIVVNSIQPMHESASASPLRNGWSHLISEIPHMFSAQGLLNS